MISMIIIYSVEYHHPTIESLCVDNKEVKLKPAIKLLLNALNVWNSILRLDNQIDIIENAKFSTKT